MRTKQTAELLRRKTAAQRKLEIRNSTNNQYVIWECLLVGWFVVLSQKLNRLTLAKQSNAIVTYDCDGTTYGSALG